MKTLILYFSYSNNTKNLVEKVNKEFNFDVARIERAVPYSDDYNTCAYGEAKDEYDQDIHPAIKKLDVKLGNYDKILLFFPIWWYTYPMPIATLTETLLKDFQGEVILFENSYTNDPQYAKNALSDVKKLAPNLHVKQGLFNKSLDEHIKFIKGE